MSEQSECCGLLLVDKPAGLTSRRAVDWVQRLVRPSKVGHAGTLDPLACGLLVLCVGPATRLIDYVQRMPKRYLATFLLGRHSPTEDVEGEVTLLEQAPAPRLDEIHCAAGRLVGRIQQRPSAFSALKVEGRRAYDLARQGKPADLSPRPVEVHGIEVLRYDYPELVLDVRCGKGTYIRALGRDLAESLGTAAVMSELVRTAIGRFDLAGACRPDEISAETLPQRLLPAQVAVEDLPSVQLSAAELKRVMNGLPIDRVVDGAPAEIAALDPDGRLVGILKPRGPGQLTPLLNLRTS
ncbi:MAG: tRNA pseudouridine(55) synthase TruB [Pirellulales bacterium]